MIRSIDFIAQVVNFLILMYLLRRFFYDPVLSFIERREEGIKRRLRESEELLALARHKRDDASRSLYLAGKEAERIIETAESRARNHLEKAQKEADRRMREALARAEEELLRERERLKTEALSEAASLAFTIAEKVVGQTVDRRSHGELLRRYLKEVK